MTVTRLVRHLKQPYKGYIPPSSLTTKQYEPNSFITNDNENIRPQITGYITQNLAKLESGIPKEIALKLAIQGTLKLPRTKYTKEIIKDYKRLDSRWIKNNTLETVINLSRAEPIMLSPISTAGFKHEKIKPNKEATENYKELSKRTTQFLNKERHIIEHDYIIAPPKLNLAGIIDFITINRTTQHHEIWDLKVSKNKYPTSKETLQLLIYYCIIIMQQPELAKEIQTLGTYNPRYNTSHSINTNQINKESIIEIINIIENL